jgi:hypothetical protein
MWLILPIEGRRCLTWYLLLAFPAAHPTMILFCFSLQVQAVIPRLNSHLWFFFRDLKPELESFANTPSLYFSWLQDYRVVYIVFSMTSKIDKLRIKWNRWLQMQFLFQRPVKESKNMCFVVVQFLFILSLTVWLWARSVSFSSVSSPVQRALSRTFYK